MQNRKVFCAMQFFNEYDILELKLNELKDVVDYFAISESDHTHSGIEKPLYLKGSNDLRFLDNFPILYQEIHDTPSNYEELKYKGYDIWYDNVVDKIHNHTHYPKNVESYLRDSFEKEILIAAIGPVANDQDIVILGDCDEIPSAEAVQWVIEHFDEKEVYHFHHTFYWYYVNMLKADEKWYGNLMCSFKTFKENSFCTMRQKKQGIMVMNAGWHFSYMGGTNKIRTKIESWGEQSLNQDWVKNNIEYNVKNCISLGRDLFGRPANFKLVDVDYFNHPKYLVDNQDKYKEYILQ